MTDRERESLMEKYEAGETTLSEEQLLFEHLEGTDAASKAWANFRQLNKQVKPSDLNEKLWTSFQNRKRKRRKLRLSMVSAAASVILVVALFMTRVEREDQSYAEKEALLEEAMSLISSEKKEQQQLKIIYESDLVSIYLEAE